MTQNLKCFLEGLAEIGTLVMLGNKCILLSMYTIPHLAMRW